MHWSTEQILALAPDPNTSKRGQGLASSKKWIAIETDGRALWGMCKSSGTAHYRTFVDLKGPAFKCSCPSRKFPCKHSIGLLLYATSNADGIKVAGERPEEVDDWIDKRDSKQSKPENQKEKTPEEIQKAEARKLKNFNDRLQLMENGIRDMENWLEDIIRTGFAAVDGSGAEMTSSALKFKKDTGPELWRNISMRMVDSKLSGIARKIRELALIHNVGADWPSRMLEELSDLYLLSKGFGKRERLSEELRKELMRILGVNTSKDELLNQQGIPDEWMVVGQFQSNNIDNAAVRRTWFMGRNTGKFALVLEYDYNNQGFPFHWPKGRIFNGEIIYYPSITPLRAIMREQSIIKDVVDGWKGCASLSDALRNYADVLAVNPWIKDYPMALTSVIPIMKGRTLYFVDKDGQGVPLLKKELSDWKIMALGAGNSIDAFGEWTGTEFNPLGIVAEGRYVGI